MSAKRSIYNEDKANAVFAVKIRKLFEESGKTHNNLAEYIEQQSGEGVTRQAIGQWCNGNTCPNLRTVPIIAEFFGVSTDYLLTDTGIKTTNSELKAVCEYTGLSENVIITLNKIKTKNDEDIMYDYVPGIVDFLISRESNTHLLATLCDYLLENYELVCIPQNENLADFLTEPLQDNNHFPAMISKRDNRVKLKVIDINAILLSQIQEVLIHMKAGD